MTACATRAPLQLLTDTRHNMPEVRRSTRRSGARPEDKEDGVGEGTAKPGTARGKRKLEFEEEDDDGFTFKRAKATRAKPGRPAKAEAQLEPKQRSKAKLPASPPLQQLVVPKARKGKRSAAAAADSERERERTPEAGPTKIALPFADTPIIRRNKEMRKGGGDGSSRRSSLSLRGRRASSLIESGTSNALPHAEVEAAEFYKHIESVLPEPRRMKQLLTWCGTRALGDKPSGRNQAALAARDIQQQLLDDFASNSELSDWFSREDTEQALPRKPNPKNVANKARIADLEAQVARLKAERAQWESLLSPSTTSQTPSFPTPSDGLAAFTTPSLSASDQQALKALPTVQPAPEPTTSAAPPSQGAQPTAQRQPTQRVAAALSSAEFEIDKLADSAHVVAELLRNADAAGRAILRGCAAALDEKARVRSDGPSSDEGSPRTEADGGGLGSRDVLRALSRVVER